MAGGEYARMGLAFVERKSPFHPQELPENRAACCRGSSLLASVLEWGSPFNTGHGRHDEIVIIQIEPIGPYSFGKYDIIEVAYHRIDAPVDMSDVFCRIFERDAHSPMAASPEHGMLGLAPRERASLRRNHLGRQKKLDRTPRATAVPVPEGQSPGSVCPYKGTQISWMIEPEKAIDDSFPWGLSITKRSASAVFRNLTASR